MVNLVIALLVSLFLIGIFFALDYLDGDSRIMLRFARIFLSGTYTRAPIASTAVLIAGLAGAFLVTFIQKKENS
jgi:hypothetical protein